MVQENLTGAVVKTQDDTIDNKVVIYFDVIEEHSLSLTSQITDNWTENNTVINDHIANQPIVINLRGISGELVYVPSTTKGTLNTLYDVANSLSGNTAIKTDKLTVIPALIPPVDNITQMAKNAITYSEASSKRYKKIIQNFLNPSVRQSRLKEIYRNLSILRENKTSIIVSTPYDTFDNMYIQSLTLRQGNQSYITDIELSLKQLNFVGTETTKADQSVLAQFNQYQRAAETNKGKVQGVNSSIIGDMVSKYRGDKYYVYQE